MEIDDTDLAYVRAVLETNAPTVPALRFALERLPVPGEERTWTLAECARFLQKSDTEVRRLMAEHGLPGASLPGAAGTERSARWRFVPSQVKAWLASKAVQATEGNTRKW